MKAKTQTPEPLRIEPELLTVEQTCRLINVKRATLYKLKASGYFAPLPVNLCRKVLYQKQEVLDWISQKCPHRKIWQTMRKTKPVI